jgi:hypothetical protein
MVCSLVGWCTTLIGRMRHRDYHERSRVERTRSYGEVSAGIAVVLTEKGLDDGYMV